MAGEPRIKGVAILPIVLGLKTIPRGVAELGPDLRHYLEDSILPSAWYPERDFAQLLAALARCLDPQLLGGEDVWVFFGRSAAQRDIAGTQHQIPNRSRVDNPGTYRHIRGGDPRDVARLLARLKTVWHLYRDQGRVVVARHASEPFTLIVRVVDYVFAAPELVMVQSAYAIEAARLLGLTLQGGLVKARERNDAYYEWHYQLEHTPERAAALQLLPLADAN